MVRRKWKEETPVTPHSLTLGITGIEDLKNNCFMNMGGGCKQSRKKIKNEIRIQHIRQVTKTYSDETRPIRVWVLTTDNSEHTTNKLKNITGILHFKITTETLRNKKTIVQCLRCQGFGHKAPFCHLSRKCRLCAQGHDTRECPNRHLPLKCAA